MKCQCFMRTWPAHLLTVSVRAINADLNGSPLWAVPALLVVVVVVEVWELTFRASTGRQTMGKRWEILGKMLLALKPPKKGQLKGWYSQKNRTHLFCFCTLEKEQTYIYPCITITYSSLLALPLAADLITSTLIVILFAHVISSVHSHLT